MGRAQPGQGEEKRLLTEPSTQMQRAHFRTSGMHQVRPGLVLRDSPGLPRETAKSREQFLVTAGKQGRVGQL